MGSSRARDANTRISLGAEHGDDGSLDIVDGTCGDHSWRSLIKMEVNVDEVIPAPAAAGPDRPAVPGLRFFSRVG
jgi:hypothetical protein